MSTAADHFTGFLDVLADALDDHEATAEDLAGRLHLSRFHLDRIVASVAGEPPSRFRRRILLERSAYRLVTTAATHPRHRGRGRATARTRRSPGPSPRRTASGPAGGARTRRAIRIEAPSDVHFHPPGGLRLPAREKVTPMDLLTKMVEHHVWLTGEIVERAARLDRRAARRADRAQRRRRPTRPSVPWLSRLVGQMGMWNAAIANRAYDWAVEEHESVDSLRPGSPSRAGVPRPGPRGRRPGASRRHVRRRAVRAGRGVHLRRDDRPRAHVRRPPPHAWW